MKKDDYEKVKEVDGKKGLSFWMMVLKVEIVDIVFVVDLILVVVVFVVILLIINFF